MARVQDDTWHVDFAVADVEGGNRVLTGLFGLGHVKGRWVPSDHYAIETDLLARRMGCQQNSA